MDDEIIGNASSPEVEWVPPPALDEKFTCGADQSPKMLVTVAAWERKQNQVKELEARVLELERRLEMAGLSSDEPAPDWFAEELRNLAARLSDKRQS